MNILGISGFENSMRVKKEHWPGLNEREYRISQGHDSAAVLVKDGVVVAAAAEERFNREKHSARFPIGAIRYCLSEGGIGLQHVDELAHGFDYSPYRRAFSLDPKTAILFEEAFSREALLAQVARDMPGFSPERVCPVSHHLAHAASACFTSGWDECLVVIVDGMGETQGASVFHAREGKLEKLREISAQDSIGILYSLVTLHLGFDFNSDEYKIMGLAPYGDPSRYRAFFESAVELRPDGTVRIPCLRLNRSRDERENYTATRAFFDANLIGRRSPDAEVTQVHQDVAAALQECLERVILHVCSSFGKQTGLRKLALAGGVSLNCTANGKLLRSGFFDEVYIQPVAGDDGVALGAALYRASLNGGVPNRRMPAPLLGPAYDDSRIRAALAK